MPALKLQPYKATCHGRVVVWDALGFKLEDKCKNAEYLCGKGCGTSTVMHDGYSMSRYQWEASDCSCPVPTFKEVKSIALPPIIAGHPGSPTRPKGFKDPDGMANETHHVKKTHGAGSRRAAFKPGEGDVPARGGESKHHHHHRNQSVPDRTITIHVGGQFEDAMLINHVLHSNAFGLLTESDLLYPLSSPAWGDAHHFLVAQACQCNPFLILQKIHHTDPFHAPLWYPMAEMLEDWVPPKPPLGYRPGRTWGDALAATTASLAADAGVKEFEASLNSSQREMWVRLRGGAATSLVASDTVDKGRVARLESLSSEARARHLASASAAAFAFAAALQPQGELGRARTAGRALHVADGRAQLELPFEGTPGWAGPADAHPGITSTPDHWSEGGKQGSDLAPGAAPDLRKEPTDMTPQGGADGGRLEPSWHSDYPGSANHELFRGNTKPYNKNVPGYAGQDKGKAPLGSVQRYKKEADAVDEWREEGEEEKRNAGHFAVPPVVYDDTLELPETTPLPEARWGLHPKLLSKKLQSEAAAHTIPQMKGVIGSEVGWKLPWAKYIFYNITKLRVNHNPLPQRTADEEREYQWGLVPEDDFNGVARDKSAKLTEALGRSLAAHEGPALLSSFTLSTVQLGALRAAYSMVAAHAKKVNIVAFYRDEKTYLIERYRQQDLFKIVRDRLGAFEYPTPTLETLIHDSLNSTSKGMDGLYRVGADGVNMSAPMAGYPVDIETVLSRNLRNRTMGWDRLISVFGRDHFRLIEYAAVKDHHHFGSNHGFDVASALVRVSAADPLPRPQDLPGDLMPGGTARLSESRAPWRSPEYEGMPKNVRSSAQTPAHMSEREIASRQLWGEFRGYAKTRANCTVVWPWEEGRKAAFASILPMATWALPMRCFDLRQLDAEAHALDSQVRDDYSDVLLYADKKAAHRTIGALWQPFCELDVPKIRAEMHLWAPRFRDQLVALPYGSCAEGRAELEFYPPPLFKAMPPAPPCDEERPATEMDPSEWHHMPPPLSPPPPSPPPLNEKFTVSFTAAATSRRGFSCASRAADRPFADDGVPTQYVHVPKAAGSSLQMLLAYYVAFPQSILYIKGEVEDHPRTPAGTIFVGHAPIVNDPNSLYAAKRAFYARNPFFISSVREPMSRMLSLYDYRAHFNLSVCTGELDDEGYYRRETFLKGANAQIIDFASCITTAQFQKDEAAAIAAGVPETGLMEHFYRKKHPYVMQMTQENQYSWFIPRDDFRRDHPTVNENSLACAMANALRVDVVVETTRYQETLLPALKYHAPYLWANDSAMIAEVQFGESEMAHQNAAGCDIDGNCAKKREKQVLSPETLEEIRRTPTFIHDERFYKFVDKVSRAREANMFACLRAANETDLRILTNATGQPGSNELPAHNTECRQVCEDVLTEDEWLMIRNADCSQAESGYEAPADGFPVPTKDELARLLSDNKGLPGISSSALP